MLSAMLEGAATNPYSWAIVEKSSERGYLPHAHKDIIEAQMFGKLTFEVENFLFAPQEL
jgi:hypothetical protein